MMPAMLSRGCLSLVVLGWVLAVFLAADGQAHGDVHQGIDDLGRQIDRASPRSDGQASLSNLHIRRADLHGLDANWDAALADLDRAAALDPRRRGMDYLRGRVLLDAGRAAEANAALHRFLTANPDHAAGRAARARALLQLDRPLEAAEEFRRATLLQPASSPDDYLGRARALRSAGSEYLGVAITALDEGIAALGPVVGLERLAMEFELEAGRTDAALVRLDRTASGLPRKETWLVRRGEILERAGRRTEAQATFEEARLALGRVPDHRRRTLAMVQLDTRISEAMVRLASATDEYGVPPLPPEGTRGQIR
ncbi:MAG: hypothetical protein GY937_07105 [bacterium]|nr:hypothetical protein [bacterium]